MSTSKVIQRFIFWVCIAVLFNVGIYFLMGEQKAVEFLGGYVIEQSLSLDNLFLFLFIFQSFGIGVPYQKRILNYGIFAAIVLRLIFVFLGVAVVYKFHWVLYIFGSMLIISGFNMLMKQEKSLNYRNSKLLSFINKIIPITENIQSDRFFVKRKGILYGTPLLAILILVEVSDIIFAVDSIPAIFSITTDAFIVYSSNIFAIVGLRNMYFLLQKINDSFKYVKYGIAIILIFTGIKLMLLIFNIEISLVYSLVVIFIIIFISMIASILLVNIQKNGY